MQTRGWLMATCQKCGKRFSTGIRMDAAQRYGLRGWSVRCPHCGWVSGHDKEDRIPSPLASAPSLGL